jgi:hypothetical protein
LGEAAEGPADARERLLAVAFLRRTRASAEPKSWKSEVFTISPETPR